MDMESVKALILINGGGAVAVATGLPAILGNNRFWPLAIPMMSGIFLLRWVWRLPCCPAITGASVHSYSSNKKWHPRHIRACA
jgi:hypothetical protein